MSEKTERALRLKIERAICEAGFTEARIRFLRDGLERLGPLALRELLSILEELSARATDESRASLQGRLW